MSRNATVVSVSRTIVAGMVPATILQNRQSSWGSPAIRPPRPGDLHYPGMLPIPPRAVVLPQCLQGPGDTPTARGHGSRGGVFAGADSSASSASRTASSSWTSRPAA